MTCEGTVTHLGGRSALAQARLTDAGGKLYAHATSSCMIFRPTAATAPGGPAATLPGA
jgi:acyl-coenzyme A thioesterase PaaI-like protein